MPTITSNSVLLDGYTYIFSEAPIQLSFTGLVSDCPYVVELFRRNPERIPDNTLFTFTKGAVDVL